MLRNRRLRRLLSRVLFVPFVIWVVIKSLAEFWTLFVPEKRDEHSGSLEHRGMSGHFVGTVGVFYTPRSVIESWLPPQLTLVPRDELPDWLQRRDDHPVILMFGTMKSGLRTRTVGRYETLPVFATFREGFFGVPYVKSDRGGPSPCFHWIRTHCSAFWPTELGISVGGWPKVQCPMKVTREGPTQGYTIRDPRGKELWLTAQTDLADPEPIDLDHAGLAKVHAMLSLPLGLVKERELEFTIFDWRLEAATAKAIPASVTLHPGFLPQLTERMDFSFARIADDASGAFFLDATFMSRLLERVPL
jgi:hypothetical protein